MDGPATRRPPDFAYFLANDDNKVQFCNLMLRIWGSDSASTRLERCGVVILVVSGKAYKLEVASKKVL